MMKKALLLKPMLLLFALIVGSSSVWADDYSIVWTISGVETAAASGSPVNTALITSAVTGGSGTWTAVAEASYATTNSGAQLGSGSYTFDGTVSLSNSSIPASATIKSIAILAKAGANYTITATVNGEEFGSVGSIKDEGTYTISGSKVGNNIVLSFACGSRKNIVLKKITVNYQYTPKAYTVILGDDNTELTETSVGAGVSLPSREAPTGSSFAGWGKNNIPDETVEAQNIISAGNFNPDADITLYPLYSRIVAGKIPVYKKVSSISEVTEGVYVWGGQKNTSGAALAYLPNILATGSNPECKEGLETEEVNNEVYLSNTITNDMLWDFTSTGTTNQYYLRPHGRKDIGLGCTTTTGTNIRISATYKDTRWTISTSSSYNWEFKSNATTPMYLVVYDFLKWRNYTSPSSNANGKFYLFKMVEVDGNITHFTSNPLTTITITPAKSITTYVSKRAIDFSNLEGRLDAYVATAAANGVVTLAKVETVPVGTPLLLKGTAQNEYTVQLASTAIAPTTNLLRAGDGTTVIGGEGVYDYILSNGLWYHASAGTVAVGKAYLHCESDPTTTTGTAPSLSMDWGEGTTGIVNVNRETINDNQYYTLDGRRVAEPTKGLYILNGRKVIVK